MSRRPLAAALAFLLSSLLVGPALASWVPPRWAMRSVFAIDAGPKAPPALDPSALPADPEAAALCKPALARLACEDAAEGDCSCAVRVFYTAPPDSPSTPHAIVRAGLVDARNGYAPGPTQELGLAVKTLADGWHQVATLGTGEVGGMGTRLRRTTDLLHRGGYDLGEPGRWVWVDVMQTRAAPDEGTTWRRTLWLCGGEPLSCNAVPLKSWFSAKVEGYPLDKAHPPQSDVPRFAFAATLDRRGVLTVVAKTKVPRGAEGLIGRHRLDALPALLGKP
ncbi:MAG: hypothetical protein EP329_13995 [Deltaproteobacteria bacterium]|nr:MAG: hypothetical protein EP329_13995 [Deltaproteobacteria bacterium]